ncbi:MAG: DUF3179 domain-containing (seleno)protein [Halobacteriales archaeon]|nr:DUF3179 domain-containing (seleno)protein [Halobacteriales archaeon]
MNRRSFLALGLTGALSGIAGCSTAGFNVGSQSGVSTRTATPDSTAQSTTSAGSSAVSGYEPPSEADLPIPESELYRGVPQDAIPAITEPKFAQDWSGLTLTFVDRLLNRHRTIEPRLQPDDRVIGVEDGERARAYPLRILNWHEIVNDTFGDPLLVTYCPLCASGLTAKRTVNGQETMFGVSGYLWNSALVMYDHLSESLWSQIAAMAIRGEQTGTRLELVPSTLTTWGTWHENHPDTEVLLPPPKSKTVNGAAGVRNYNDNPYASYQGDRRIGLGANELPDHAADLHPKAQVLGVATDTAAKAYPLETVVDAGVINDTVGEVPVVVSVGKDDFTLVAYDRRVDGDILTFSKPSTTHLKAGGSRWTIASGQAVDGQHEGTVLSSVPQTQQLFWFAWLDFNPNTAVYTPE